ncbi:MAG TPA: 2-C-methyl-D-erythritol 4-phosphate cytidylyltransferase [Candidatus Kapabacteria bacterium]
MSNPNSSNNRSFSADGASTTRDVAAILVAGGSSIRFGKPKQFELLGDIPIYEHVVRVFANVNVIHTIVLVSRADDLEEMERGLKQMELPTKFHLVAGGETRQDSVSNGLNALKKESDIAIAVVHDVARPLVDEGLILSVIGAIRQYGSAVAGLEIVDTLKRVVNHEIVETVNRENLWRAQTPQGGRIELLRAAYDAAREAKIQGTDESQVLEHMGEQPRLVAGSNMNFKITYPIDLERARLTIDRRKKAEA